MSSLASELKTERERRGISLVQIAEETCISLRHLQSLEEGRYSDMPGGIYNRAFIKSYCDILKLDPQSILQKYEAELSPHPEKPAKSPTFAQPKKKLLRSNPIFIWSLMLIISATGLFFSRKWIFSVFSPYVPHTSVSALKSETNPATTSAMIADQALIPAESSGEATTPSPDAKASLETAAFAASDSASLKIEFDVKEKCWISVESDDGPVVSKLLEPGEAQTFNASQQFKIVIGNAGGVQLRINGQPAKPLGKPGEVVKKLINYQNLPDLINHTTG